MLPSIIDNGILLDREIMLPGGVERREITSREEWLEWRPADVTGSAVSALFGYHPYCTVMRLWAEKRGAIFPDKKDNKVLQRGRWCEPAVAAAARELSPDWAIVPADCYLRNETLRLGATPDFFIHDDVRGLGVLQAKTAAPSVFYGDWDGGREVPMWITLQTVTEMLLADAAFGAIAVLNVDAYDMQCMILEVPRHAAAEAKICAKVKDFWLDVARGTEPDPDFYRDAEAIRALAPKSEQGRLIDLSGHNQLPFLLAQRANCMKEIDDLKARKEAVETEIKFLMREAEVATGLKGWRITYKTSGKRGFTVDPNPDYRPLLIQDRRSPEQKAADDKAATSGSG
jgi:predicted phage-related endonuclease